MRQAATERGEDVVLYTVVPLYEVLAGWDEPRPEPISVEMEGRTLLIEPESPYAGRIVRLISSNPNDFLDPAFQPGRRLVWWGPRP